MFHSLIYLKKKSNFFFYIVSAINPNPIQEVNMMYLSREATNKDQSLKMQMLLSLDKDDSNNTENKLEKEWFFWRPINKATFPESTLVYCNQGKISTLKAGDYAIYIDYVVLGQVILGKNCPDLDNYTLKENKVILYMPLYNTENGFFRGVKKWLAYIMVRGDSDESFFS